MRTSIKSIVATGLMTLAISISSVYATVAPAPKFMSTYGADISSIKKIIVSGNVYVNIVQAPKSKVLYQNESNTNVVVKMVNNSLIIEGDNHASQPGEITIYINDIYRIDASGSAVVTTKGPLALKNLQVFVKENAKVDVNAKTESLYTVINDGAELKLQGHTRSHILTMDHISKITLTNFSAIKTEKSNSEGVAYAAVRN